MNLGKGIGMLVLIFSLSLFFISGEAQEKRGVGKGEEKKPGADRGFGFTTSRDPIDIISDTVEANQKQNTVTFKGNVVAKQDDTTLYANTLDHYLRSGYKETKRDHSDRQCEDRSIGT